jgi:hypothetical protein
MKTHTYSFSYDGDTITLDNGNTLTVSTPYDETHREPWKECDGHGIISEWTSRDKAAGEWILASDGDSRRFYDFAETIKLAKRDGWGLGDEHKTELTRKLGRAPTKREITAESVRRDYEFLRGWCNDQWTYIGVTVTLTDPDGKELGEDSLWGVESFGDYWKEIADELAETLVSNYEKEQAESLACACRDIETA